MVLHRHFHRTTLFPSRDTLAAAISYARASLSCFPTFRTFATACESCLRLIRAFSLNSTRLSKFPLPRPKRALENHGFLALSPQALFTMFQTNRYVPTASCLACPLFVQVCPLIRQCQQFPLPTSSEVIYIFIGLALNTLLSFHTPSRTSGLTRLS